VGVAGQFRVEPARLSQAGAQLASAAEVVAGVDVAGVLSRAVAAVSASGTAGQAAALAGELSGALDAQARATQAMSEAASTTGQNYLAADAHGAALLGGPGGSGSW
jgi:hypothetical protein